VRLFPRSFRDSELEARRADLEAKRRALQAEGDELLKLQTVLEVGEREAALLRTASAELQVQENAVKHQLAGFERSSDAEEMAVLNQVAETGNLAHVPQLDSLQRQLNHVRKQRQDLEKICDGFGTALGRGSVH
jgi:chromosome segregation ATPase